MIKCIIVDDEPLAIKVIESFIRETEGLTLVAACNDAVDAFNIVSKQKIDLIFLDIKMPKITGLAFIKMLNEPPKIILTTAYREYALEGFDLEVVDYLLKPVSFERFLKAVDKVYKLEKLSKRSEHDDLKLIDAHDEKYIFLKSDKKMVKVLFKDFLYVEGLKDYVTIVTKNEKLISYLSLNYLEEMLPSEKFLRIHRSFIISINQIQFYTASEISLPGKTIPIGRHYKKEVIGRLEKLNNIGK